MESKTLVFGHPLHPMLIVFPLGLFISAVIFDILYLALDNPIFASVAFWDIAFGVTGGLLAAVFGFRDWLAIPQGTRAKRIGLVHGLGNFIVVVLFLLSLFLRWVSPDYTPSLLALIFSFTAVVIGAVAGWLGGELVDRLGVGVYPAANLNAPSSLSEKQGDRHMPGQLSEH